MKSGCRYCQGSYLLRVSGIHVGRILGCIGSICVINFLYAERWTLKVGNRLKHPEKEEPNADTRGEEHRQPRKVGVFRLRIFPTEAHLAEWGKCHH